MARLPEIFRSVSTHRAFLPVLVAAIALVLGVLLAFEHSRNLLKVRGPYLIVLAVIISFPVFAFRFFDPHEDERPISAYFILTALYFILLGSPDFVAFFRMVLFERIAPGAIRQLVLGLLALAASAGGVHYALRLKTPAGDEASGFLSVSLVKFSVYAVLHIIYLNLFVAIARERFGIMTVFS